MNSLYSSFGVRSRGLTMVELLVVIAILVVLMSLLIPGLGAAKKAAEASKNTVNVREIALSTISWASDNQGKLPSPQYPGGTGMTEDELPEHWDLGAETGLWLDGVVFGAVYLRGEDGGAYEVDEDGTHLKGTLFENTQAVKSDPTEEDWHRHSYAMNANLQYDRIYDQIDTSDPYLTEKTMSNLIFAPKAMLYIENNDSNIVYYEDRENIIESGEDRWGTERVIAAFLDGHAERLSASQIPDDGLESDRETSRFWRGVDAR